MAHYYDKNGAPRHTQKTGPRAKYPTRPTTIKDAEEKKLFPSVSAITGMLSKDWLAPWKVRETMKEAFASPPIGSEDFDTWKRHVCAEADKKMAFPAEFGTLLHAEIEEYFTSQNGTLHSEYAAYIEPAIEHLEGLPDPVVASERVVVNAEFGYAGTLDVELQSGSLADFKSTGSKPGKPMLAKEEHVIQLAAYFRAAHPHEPFQECRNIYISRDEIGRIEVKVWTPEELDAGWEAFKLCLGLFRYRSGWDSRQTS